MKSHKKKQSMFLLLGLGLISLIASAETAMAQDFVTITLDGDGEGNPNVGLYTSIAVDKNDRPHISYYDSTNGDLKYAGLQSDCTWTIKALEEIGGVDSGRYTSIFLAAQVQPYISCYRADEHVRVWWRDMGWDKKPLHQGRIATCEATGVAVVDGKVNFVYYNSDIGELRLVTENGPDGWTPVPITVHSGWVWDFSLAISPSDKFCLAYIDGGPTSQDLRFAWNINGSWEFTWTEPIEGLTVWIDSVSLAMDAHGSAHIAYTHGSLLKYVKGYLNGNTWVPEDSATFNDCGGPHCSIAVGSDGVVHIAYYTSAAKLGYAKKDPGEEWSTTTADDNSFVGQYNSIAVDSDGNPHISYYDEGNGDLKYAYVDGDGGIPDPSIRCVDVDAVGFNNGLGWANAFNCLQDALAVEGEIKEIRVAQGVYKPDQGAWVTPHDRTATFRLRSGLSIKGGYAGFCHEDPDSRDFEMFETVLSGDLLGNDTVSIGGASLLDAPSRADNSNHVVTGSNTDLTALLDGFTIEGGRADRDGGGMFNEDGSPTIQNCIFRLNSAEHAGGAMYNWRSSPKVEDCNFVDNYAIQSGGLYSGVIPTLTGDWTVEVSGCTFQDNQGESGGGLLNWGKCNTKITGCYFIGNSAGEGAGICSANQTGKIEVIQCQFIDNSSRLNGGGAVLRGEGVAILRDCRFINNKAQSGGGIMIEEGHNDVISCWFESNGVTVDGGGAYVKEGEYDFVSCQFLQNTAEKTGGGICTDNCSLDLFNCALLDLNSAYQGGGLAIRDSDTEIINCTITGNSSTGISTSNSHGLWSDGPTLTIANSIVWDDDGPAIVLKQYPKEFTVTIDFSCVPDEYSVYGLWNISSDPKTYASGGLMPGSACIDAGNDALVPPDTYNLDNDIDIYEPLPYDVLGNPRFVDDPATPNGPGGIVDMGAFEYQPDNPG